MIIKALGYLLYRIYARQLTLEKKTIDADTAAQGTVLFFIIFNILALEEIIDIFTGIDLNAKYLNFLQNYNITKLDQLIVGVIIWMLVDKIISRNNVYKKLEKKYKHETSMEKLKGTILIWIYYICSIIAFVLAPYFAGDAHRANFTVFGYVHNYFLK